MTKLCKKFDKMGKDYEAPARVASEMQSEMVTFCRDCNPLLEILCTAGLKERHWTMMNEITSLDIPYMEEEMTLESCLEHGLESCVKDIEETCVNATKEYSLETALDNMVTDWDGLEFGTKAYKDSGKTDVVLFFLISNHFYFFLFFFIVVLFCYIYFFCFFYLILTFFFFIEKSIFF